ncbi:2-succinyl-5-enolpyruvyl-6-hydroxy-3-cyclohexene-1-carboxylic-acid synthase [uncultured Thiodictyon sp.]|uniref:2-succinyl-5-enolpyruvyl-6-hydroxy-3- cyclohexene-1-carboxylic-acid synthase n=1 Tax=uncultured Thiodictyon sp. TaxID=1846217 RepID=UPI0025CFD8B8|nr:2-succinyl-5-enolpyruvyl-6-hydroxy-3-cyclohexene-1-carboxylic-acid synthase [uncultured Thiodictyon sp.]
MSATIDPERDPAGVGVAWCLALLDGLMAGGVRHLVLSPGSRSTPVILAAQQRPGLTLTPILDERSAAFYALGLARAGARPVALLATSGSAPAHWYPAVMEANAAGVPLVLLSADRPPEWRGWGANQTTDQTRLFGTQVRAFHDPGAPVDTPAARRAMTALGRRAAAVSQGQRPGPVHINLPLREPLVPRADPGLAPPTQAPGIDTAAGALTQTLTLPPGLTDRLRGRGLIYCGPDAPRPGFAAAVMRCAAALGVPLLADPLSELRFGTIAGEDPGHSPRITRYKTLVRNPQAAAALRPDWVLRFGRAPVSKTLLDWLPGIPLILVDPGEHWSDPAHELAQERSLHLAADPTAICNTLAATPPTTADPAWLPQWTRAQERLATLAAQFLTTAPWCEGHLIGDLVANLPAGDGLLCANSLPIRQFETWSGSREAPLTVFGNRGLSGIDGQLSTLAGLNAAGIPTTGLLGDLSFLHDLSGLLLATRLERPCIVINNGGGRIFDYLPQLGLPDFERLWRTPRPVAIDALAGSFGLRHRRVADAAGWRAALTQGLAGAPGPLIEVMIDADQSREVHFRFRERVAEAQLL